MATVRQVTLKPLRFDIFPQKMSVSGRHTKLQLAAILQPEFGVKRAQIIASLKGSRQKIHYSQEIKKFIKKSRLDLSFFAPLEAYLKDQLALQKRDPDLFLSLLKKFIKCGKTPDFTVSFLDDSSSSSSSNS